MREVSCWRQQRLGCRSFGVKVRSQICIRYVPARLSKNSPQGTRIEFLVTRDRQRLFLSVWANAPQFDVATCLSMYGETKAFQDMNDFGSR